MYFTVTTIGFFDSMGAASVDYILNQTVLTSIFASNDYINKLIIMKKDGMAGRLKHLVSFDLVSASQVEDADKVGLKLFTIQHVME
jgi:long-subunit acyl-CoA synthetase (AMP-forming)